MYRYRFKCSDEDRVRAHIERRISSDVPDVMGIFNSKFYKKGIHFKLCGEYICGFYLPRDAKPKTGSNASPFRVCFRGRFIKKENETVFEVYIYPRLVELFLLSFILVGFALTGKVMGFALAAVGNCFVLSQYGKMIKETASEISLLFV